MELGSLPLAAQSVGASKEKRMRSSYGPFLATLLVSAGTIATGCPVNAADAARDYEVLHSFGISGDGFNPEQGNVAVDSAGNIYGATEAGGANGRGIAYKIAPDGTETILHSFAGGANDGSNPVGGVIYDESSGTLAGTTFNGGSTKVCGIGCGVAYALASDGALTVLHLFKSGSKDGQNPVGGLSDDKNLDVYGTTQYGGSANMGTVYKLSPSGHITVLYSFTGPDGDDPLSRPIRDGAGNLYGVTTAGGANNSGAVFEVARGGTETVLYSFTGGDDGKEPYGALARDRAGNLYGTTLYGGASGAGVVFRLAPDGTFAVLYTFIGGADGSVPQSDLILIGKTLYGTTDYGGAFGFGTVFSVKITDGTEKVLHSFGGYPAQDGGIPLTSLAAGTDGYLYGATYDGGANGDGTVFKVKR
jgi:uncharacterized repeat protein (TIGR03803 family)